ncbi:hypothetical protein IL306_000267 [Fusarium sp. DS 682]|nr:hypothetical protein IL306_000267 [Fusarium sp. DS 682]
MINGDFICVPFNMLSAENNGSRAFLSKPVEKQREKIRDLIIGKPDHEVFESKEAMKIIRDLGSDTNINCFALNWKDKDGNLNTDLEEANYLMKRVVDRLSITSANTDPTEIPIFLTSTQFLHEDYGSCAHKFMERMGVEKSDQSLFVIRNVVMSPFPTRHNFIDQLMGEFKQVVGEEVEKCRKRNKPGQKKIQFLVQGSPGASEVFLSFQASFHSATKRQQIILSGTLDSTLRDFHKELTGGNQDSIVMLESADKVFIEDVVEVLGDLDVIMYEKGTKKYHQRDGKITLNSVVKSRPLNSTNRELDYPAEFMPFYLYGNETEIHCSHMLVTAPNISLAANNITFDPPLSSEINHRQTASELLAEGLILGLTEIPEASMQPFAERNQDLAEEFFFRQGQTFMVKIWKDPKDASAHGPGLLKDLGRHLYEGKMTLGENVFVDAEGPNEDKLKERKVESDSWQRKLDEVGSLLDGTHVDCQVNEKSSMRYGYTTTSFR